MYPGNEEKQALARKIMQKKARDHARTPVQWDSEPHAGFSSADAKPWMRVNDDYKTVNAQAQIEDAMPSSGTLSVHAFWQRGLRCRKENKDVFVYGDFQLLDPEHKKVVAYKRWSKENAFVTVLNLSGEKLSWDGLKNLTVKKWVAGNYDETDIDGKSKSDTLELRPWEALLGMLE
jgi:oligo-1,6-glucosidase